MTLSDKAKYKSTERFSGLANKYARGRPSYPSEAIDFIVEHCQLKEGGTVADIGCGTGIASRLFAQRNMRVKGIEPNEDMRKQALEDTLTTVWPKLEYLAGTAEDTGLQDSSIDLAICAQAFHWFDPDKALTEFHRILTPKGWIVLMWNERDDSDTFTNAYSQLIRAIPGAARLEMGRSTAGEILLRYPTFSQSQKILFSNKQDVDEEGLLNRASSTSYAPKDPEIANQLANKLKALFVQYQAGNKVSFAYITSLYIAQRRAEN
jgi:ubiquinone/menaquinone biosynthesis C-methylase UbiE